MQSITWHIRGETEEIRAGMSPKKRASSILTENGRARLAILKRKDLKRQYRLLTTIIARVGGWGTAFSVGLGLF